MASAVQLTHILELHSLTFCFRASVVSDNPSFDLQLKIISSPVFLLTFLGEESFEGVVISTDESFEGVVISTDESSEGEQEINKIRQIKDRVNCFILVI